MKRGWSPKGGWPLFLNHIKNHSMNCKLFLLLIMLVGISCNESPIEEQSTRKEGWGGFNGGYMDEYHHGKITYLIFHKSENIHVVNYTSDSMEYEFLHQPTKQSNETDTPNYSFSDHSDLKKVQQPE